jgi:hypothetical protein
MTDELTTKLSFRLNTAVLNALAMCAADEGYETMAYIQKVLTRRAIESGFMADDEAAKTQAYEKLFEIAVQRSRELYKEIPFSEQWTLLVFQQLMQHQEFRPKYEAAIGGDAYEAGLSGKTPLNMYLGWYIKNAIGAEPKIGPDGKPLRVQVKNEPIQSYTLLLPGSDR